MPATSISALHPDLQPVARRFLAECERAGLRVIITCTLRTSEEQDALYALGRTRPGKIVTNARAGHSAHNHGRAFDVCFLTPEGQPTWDEPSPGAWDLLGEIGRRCGLRWGGDWKRFKDRPHFELHEERRRAAARK